MGARRVVFRILGIASTIRGFAYAITEDPMCLVSSGTRGTPASGERLTKAIDTLLLRARPLFIAFEQSSGKKRDRGRLFAEALVSCCEARKIMILTVGHEKLRGLTALARPNKWDIANVIVLRFPEIAHKLPGKRKPWQSEDDRIGMFMALAAAVCAWQSFKEPMPNSKRHEPPSSSASP